MINDDKTTNLKLNENRCKKGCKKQTTKLGQMEPALWDFVRMSRGWCVNTADGEMFGDSDVPVVNAAS